MDAVVTPSEMRLIDESAPESTTVLIQRAGGAVARAGIELLGGTYGRRVVILAGKGNNGADGREAARRLRARGVRCTVVDARQAPDLLPPADLVIDAAVGTGFHGRYDAPEPADPDTPVLAVDLPSGLDGLTGQTAGRVLVADRTVTFAALKPGLLLAAGPESAGTVTVADIGLDVSAIRTHLVDDQALAAWLPRRPRRSHKWRSAVRVIAGSPGMTGAAHLATRAAQRAGAGYVRLSTPGSASDPGAPTEAVVTPLSDPDWSATVLGDLDRFGALVLGPGLGTDPGALAEARRLIIGSTGVPVVVDGDGLRALGRDVSAVLGTRGHDAEPVVLTPHDGEFEALTGHPPAADRLAEARDLADVTGAVVLLKGPTTVVADPSGDVLVCTAGDERLASAGTGDVLSGILAALLAQGVPALRAAGAGAHLHGRAGALAWRRGVVAGDIPDRIPVILDQLSGG